MKYKMITRLILASFFSINCFATDVSPISLHGYGTLGVAYQDNDDVLYRNTLNTKKGSRGDISLANYSSFGLQVDVQATENLSLVAQGVASEKNSNGKFVELGWLNAKYQLSDASSVRVGKMRLPAFMYSDILDVSYSYDWIHLPDMYSIVPINNYTGIEFNHNIEFDKFTLMSTLLYGEAKSVLYYDTSKEQVSESNVDVDEMYGVAFKILYDELVLRFAYSNLNITLNNKNLDYSLNQLNSLGIPQVSQAINDYSVKDASMTYLEVGARYDFENAYLLAEYIEFKNNTFFSDNTSWYIGSGYNFEKWSPFMLYSKLDSSSNYQDIKTNNNMPQELIGAINASNGALGSIAEGVTNIELETFSLGLRYNLSENSVLKFQYDRQKERTESRLNFHFSENKEVDLDVFSAAVSFVF